MPVKIEVQWNTQRVDACNHFLFFISCLVCKRFLYLFLRWYNAIAFTKIKKKKTFVALLLFFSSTLNDKATQLACLCISVTTSSSRWHKTANAVEKIKKRYLIVNRNIRHKRIEKKNEEERINGKKMRRVVVIKRNLKTNKVEINVYLSVRCSTYLYLHIPHERERKESAQARTVKRKMHVKISRSHLIILCVR